MMAAQTFQSNMFNGMPGAMGGNAAKKAFTGMQGQGFGPYGMGAYGMGMGGPGMMGQMGYGMMNQGMMGMVSASGGHGLMLLALEWHSEVGRHHFILNQS